MAIYEDTPTPRIDDNGVREALAYRLLREGVSTPRGVVRVELIDGTQSAFVVLGRVLVPVDQADRVVKLCRVDEVTEIEGTGLVAIDTKGPTLDLLQRLNAIGVNATPDHVMMSASRIFIKEGEDPEYSDGPTPKDTSPKGARVVVIDTGLDPAASASGWFKGVGFSADNEDALYSSNPLLAHGGGHGTFVSGIVRQVSPDCNLTVLKALDEHGVGLETEIARSLVSAIGAKPKFVLCAFGGYTYNDAAPAAIEAAVRALVTATKCVIVAAGGNERQTVRPLWPASLRDVQAIAAVESDVDGTLVKDGNGQALLTGYTNTGPTIEFAAAGRWASVFATGEEDPRFETDGVPDSFKGYAYTGGTSMASAAVVGALAAIAGSRGSASNAWTTLTSKPITVAGSKRLQAIDVWDFAV